MKRIEKRLSCDVKTFSHLLQLSVENKYRFTKELEGMLSINLDGFPFVEYYYGNLGKKPAIIKIKATYYNATITVILSSTG